MGKPWYASGKTWVTKADGFLEAVRRLPPGPEQQEELTAFTGFSAARMIFESNRIEGTGLSDGETRRVLGQLFPKLTAEGIASRLRHSIPAAVETAQEMIAALSALGVPVAEDQGTISFEGREKGVREVGQHYQALLVAMAIAGEYRQRLADYAMAQQAVERPEIREFLIAQFDATPAPRAWMPLSFGVATGEHQDVESLGDEPFIDWVEAAKVLHKTLAADLLPDDCDVPAGVFRVDARSVGSELAFPAPEALEAAMQKWDMAARDLVWKGPLAVAVPSSAIGAAAEVSYHFVRIHPFPDGNGRVSRLLLNIVLFLWGLPFPIALRGDGKERHRYKQALRRADRGNLDRYECLIARAVVGSFENLNVNLALAGKPTIDSHIP